jgi:hypothetical protein
MYTLITSCNSDCGFPRTRTDKLRDVAYVRANAQDAAIFDIRLDRGPSSPGMQQIAEAAQAANASVIRTSTLLSNRRTALCGAQDSDVQACGEVAYLYNCILGQHLRANHGETCGISFFCNHGKHRSVGCAELFNTILSTEPWVKAIKHDGRNASVQSTMLETCGPDGVDFAEGCCRVKRHIKSCAGKPCLIGLWSTNGKHRRALMRPVIGNMKLKT